MTSQGAEGLSLCPGLSASPFLLSRLGQTLSVRGEDIGEDTFSEAMGRAVGQWPGAKLLDHGCVESSILGKLSHQFLPLVLRLAVPQPIPILLGDLKEGGKKNSVSFAAPNESPSLCLPPSLPPFSMNLRVGRNRGWGRGGQQTVALEAALFTGVHVPGVCLQIPLGVRLPTMRCLWR